MSAVPQRVAHIAPAARRLDPVIEIARQHAPDVDARARYPHEAMQALKDARLMGIMIPEELGGEGLGLADVVEMCSRLGQTCSSTAMIFAMHHIKASSLVTHGLDSTWHRGFMRRVVDEQLLLGSATTEAGIGGNMRTSSCAIEMRGDAFHLEKAASVISYGLQCDAILVTARRHADSPASDQVMAVATKDQYRLEQTGEWDTLGMRGTCSLGFAFACDAPAEQIFPHSFAEIAAQSMLAMAHIMWSGAWYGIAADAVARAQAYVRADARKTPGVTPPTAGRLTETIVKLQEMKAVIRSGIAQYEAVRHDDDALASVSFAMAMNAIKISTSEMAADIVRRTMMITGIAGYRNDGRFSVARHMRDVLSAAIMVNNDRILGNSAHLVLAGKHDTSLVA